jgi:hypothetical protein
VVAVLSSVAVSVAALGLLLVKYCSAAMPAMLATIRSVNGVMLMVLPTSALVAAETRRRRARRRCRRRGTGRGRSCRRRRRCRCRRPMSTVFWAPRLSLTVTLPMIGAPAAVPEMSVDGWR